VIRKSRSKYILCTDGREPVEIDIFAHQDPFDDVFLTYWVHVFQWFEANSSLGGLTFYVIWDYQRVRDLPSYGNDVVAIVLMDEYGLIPHYLGRVRFVFKTYGFRPWLSGTSRGKTLATMLKFIKDIGNWTFHLAAFVRKNGGVAMPKNRMVIPLGYARQTDIAVKPFETRRYLVSFLGSVEQRQYHTLSPRALLGTPKSEARSRMAKGLRKLASALPDKVFFAITGSFSESILSDGAGYSELMADTKICLAPRGSSVETYRFFEALRQGCVIICDRLPPYWFYRGCPAIQIDDWRDLEAQVNLLLADPQRLLALHHEALAWWEEKCSERAMAAVLVRCLEAPAEALEPMSFAISQ
jgi:Exostosin family